VYIYDPISVIGTATLYIDVRTCLKPSGLRAGLLVNFNEARLVDGIRRWLL
jgi:hypothetical protein